jgi:hypothetical protein
MPNPRTCALIGLASAAAAIAARPITFEGTPRLDRPDVYSIIVRADTVWFCARAYPAQHRSDYAFVRRSSKWLAGRRSARCDRESPIDQDDSVHRVGRGIVIRASQSDDRSRLVVSDSTRKRRTVLRPSFTPARLKELQSLVGAAGSDTVSTTVRDVVVNDSLIWIGLWGGFPEGEGVMGGVYRIDRRTGASRYIVDATLAAHAVNGLADAGGSLWIATEHPGEYGPVGFGGLIRLNSTGARREAFTDDNSPLPDALIRDVAADSRLVAVATEQGLAIGELGAKGRLVRWNVQHFTPAFVGDSLVMSLGDRPAEPSESSDAVFMFLQRFGAPGREKALYELVRKTEPDSLLKIVAEYEPNVRSLLSDSTALPAIETMLGARREAQLIAARALAELEARVPSMTPRIRSAFNAVDTATTELRPWSVVRGELGRALNRAQDSTGLRWARATLERARREPVPPPAVAHELQVYNIVAAARIAADAKDVVSLEQLLAIAPVLNRGVRGDLIEPLLAFDLPIAWQSALAMTEAGYVDRSRLIDALRSVRAVDSAFTPRVTSFLVQALADSNDENRRRAAVTARSLRFSSTVPALIRAIDTDKVWLRDELYVSLISLTGRADAPAPQGDLPRSGGEWWVAQQQAATDGKLAVVPREQGERAVVDWLRRRRRIP